MNVLLVRHGEILSNINKIYAGKSPEPLTEKGIRQAREVAKKLQKFEIDHLYSSPIQRALQTAQIISAAVGIDVKVDPAFREIEMGPWEGLSEIEVARKYPEEWKLWNNTPAELRLPGRETLEELLKRVLSGIKKIIHDSNGKNISIVTHVAIIRVLMLWSTDRSLNLYKTLRINNAGIYQITLPTYFSSRHCPKFE